MRTRIREFSGEQLLLMVVLCGPRIRALIKPELDHRALFGPSPRLRRVLRGGETGRHEKRALRQIA